MVINKVTLIITDFSLNGERGKGTEQNLLPTDPLVYYRGKQLMQFPAIPAVSKSSKFYI